MTATSQKSAWGPLQDMLGFELEHGQLSNFQLRLVDRHSMAHGLEVRPFLGRRTARPHTVCR